MRTALVLVALLCFASPASAQSLKAPTLVYSAAMVTDWATTYGYQPPGSVNDGQIVREGNPLVGWIKSTPAQAAVGAAIDVGVLVLVRKTLGPRHPTLTKRVLYIGAAVRFGFAAWNVRLNAQ